MIGRVAAAQRANVPPFHVMDLLQLSAERQRSHGDLINLLAGQPSTGAPAPVNARAMELLASGDPLGYTPATGIVELREAIAGHHRTRYGIDVGAEDVVVTTGSSGGFLLAFLAAFEVGDRVAIARPGYPCYRNVLAALGCQVVEIDAGAETRFQPTVAQLEELHRTTPIRGLVVASPANPTGTMLLPEELAAIASWCETNGVQLVSDEIYHGIEYPAGSSSCAWQTSREAVVFGSFSKYFSMTGWRLGWMLAPARLRRAVDVLMGNFSICAPVLDQHAANNVFVDIDRECKGGLLGDSSAAESGISSFHLDDCGNQLEGRTFGAWCPPAVFGSEEQTILSFHEGFVETHDRRGLEYYRASDEPKREDEACTEAGDNAIHRSQIRCSLAGAIKDQQLMPEQYGLGDNRPSATAAE
jgi:aspartate/methionine/tyrosine aminotransferase